MKNGSSPNRGYLLTVLLTVLALSGIYGVAMGLLLHDIKVDLHLSDAQLGLLTGLATSLSFSVISIPMARWADRGNRVTIIALTTALLSAMLVLYGVAANFQQLLLIQLGVAVGLAGFSPAALSLIADHFTRAERPRAVGRYMLGNPLCYLIGYWATGWLNQWFGWRTTIVLLGVPGLGVAALVWFTLKEPRVATAASAGRDENCEGGDEGRSINLWEVVCGLWDNTTVRHLLAFMVITGFFSTAASQFQPTFLIRSYGLKTGELGTWFAVLYGLTGLLGTYWGGAWASRRAANNERLQLKAMAVASSCSAVLMVFVYLSTNRYAAIVLMGVSGLVSSIPTGPLFATIQSLVPARGLATSTATISVLTSLIGSGLGPLAAGALSDALHPMYGAESLRHALLAFCPGGLWGAWHLWRASQSVARDLEATQR